MAWHGLAAVDGEVLVGTVGAGVELPDGPSVAGRGRGHGVKEVVRSRAGAGYLGPLRPVPVQDQGVTVGAAGIDAHRPGVARAGSSGTLEDAVPGAMGGLLGPRLPVPGQDQCLARGALIEAHRPGLSADRVGRDAVQKSVVGGPTGIGAGYLSPLLAVPVQDEAPVRGAVEERAHRPGVAGGGRGYARQLTLGSRVRAGYLGPLMAVPAQDQRLARGAVANGAHRPGVGRGHGADRVEHGSRS